MYYIYKIKEEELDKLYNEKIQRARDAVDLIEERAKIKKLKGTGFAIEISKLTPWIEREIKQKTDEKAEKILEKLEKTIEKAKENIEKSAETVTLGEINEYKETRRLSNEIERTIERNKILILIE